MRRYKDEPPAVRVYTVCDESRYLIIGNVPSVGCGDYLLKLFATYGSIEECKPMDAEDCEPFTTLSLSNFACSATPAGRSKVPMGHHSGDLREASLVAPLLQPNFVSEQITSQQWGSTESQHISRVNDSPITRVSSDKDYFASQSMNHTVRLVREKLNKSCTEHQQAGPTSKRPRLDIRRRI